MAVLHALPIATDPVDGDGFLARVEKLGRCGEVGEEEERDETPGKADCAKDDKHIHPLRQTGGDVPHRVANQPTKHRREAIRAVIRFQPQGLLGGGIPNTHNEHKGRVDDGFGDAEEEAVGGDAAERGARGCGHDDGTPYDGDVGGEFADGEFLEGVGGGELGDEVAKVEDGAEPGVVLADEVGAGLEAKIGSEVEGVCDVVVLSALFKS